MIKLVGRLRKALKQLFVLRVLLWIVVFTLLGCALLIWGSNLAKLIGALTLLITFVNAIVFGFSPETKENLITALHKAGCIKFGDFVLHSGAHSPIYVDLRLLVSYPKLLKEVARAYVDLLEGLKFDRLAAIPYAGLPIGVAVSLQGNWPLIYPREAKAYGTKQSIEGVWSSGDIVVAIDDLITDGASKIAAIQPLIDAGLIVFDVVVLIDRQQGGKEKLNERGYKLYALFTLKEIVQTLNRLGKINGEQCQKVLDYLS